MQFVIAFIIFADAFRNRTKYDLALFPHFLFFLWKKKILNNGGYLS